MTRTTPSRPGRSGPPKPPRMLVAALSLALVGQSPATAQEAPSVHVAHAARYAATPISMGLRHVLAANRFSAFLAADGGAVAPGSLASLAREAQLDGHALLVYQASENATPTGHWAQGGADEASNRLKAALRAGGVDVLMLTMGTDASGEGLDRFGDLMIEDNMEGRILVQDSWSSGVGSEADKVRTETVRARLAAINARAGHQMAYLVPAADAVDRLRWEVSLGKVPGVSRQSELFGGSPAQPGTPIANLVSYVWFITMYTQPAGGLTALIDRGDPTSAERERILQQIAWDAAAAEPMSGLLLEHLWLGRSRGPHAQHGGEASQGVHIGHE